MHPAYKYTFDELYQNLLEEEKNEFVKSNTSGNLVQFTYTEEATFQKHWNDFTMSARGIILDIVNKKIVACPFPKFFNYGESTISLPDESFIVSEKLDGSLGIAYFYDNKWNVNTKGSFTSGQSVWATEYLNNLDISVLDKNTTYLFEVIFPENRIVVRYSFSDMVLLVAYKNGIELSKLELDNVANQLKVRRPEIFEYTSIDQILEICKHLEATSEGFVVRFESGLRVKIKGEQYVAIHRIISGIKPLNIWTALTTNTDLDVVFKQLPEEFIKDGKVIRDILLNNFNKTMAESNKVYEQYKHLPRKEIGLNNTIDPMYKAHLFCRLDGNFSKVEQLVWKMIRPDGNKLSGYVPSSSLNLFDQENK